MKVEIEKWKDVEGYNGLYRVSTLGRVRSFYFNKRGKIMKAHLTQQGYPDLGLKINGLGKQWRVHKLVANAFTPNPDSKPQINHKNGIKTDNRVENLEWVTAKENSKHAWKNNLMDSREGERNGNAKMSLHKIKRLRLLKEICPRITQCKLGSLFGVRQPAISDIFSGRRWK